MAAEDIRIAWNTVTQRLCALRPDDHTYGPAEVAFNFTQPDHLPEGTARPGLLIGPTLREIIAAMEETRPA